MGRWARTHRLWPLARAAVLGNRLLWSVDLPLDVGDLRHVFLMHSGLGTVINPGVRIEGPAIVFQHVTLGAAFSGDPARDGAPTLGRWVLIGAGASVLGAVQVGDAVIIGAGAVVTRDVPTGSLVTGNPATVRPIPPAQVLSRFHPNLQPDVLGLPHPDTPTPPPLEPIA